jgi:hypothetical protein
MAQVYQNNISSVHTKHPELDLDLGLDLDRSILKGQEIVPGDLSHAKGVAGLLKATRGKFSTLLGFQSITSCSQTRGMRPWLWMLWSKAQNYVKRR